MDQSELNKVEFDSLRIQSVEVAAKSQKILLCDAEERSKKVPWEVLHHIHNMSLFECLVWLNSMALFSQDDSEELLNEYTCFAETLRPKFLDIVEALKDFQPTESA